MKSSLIVNFNADSSFATIAFKVVVNTRMLSLKILMNICLSRCFDVQHVTWAIDDRYMVIFSQEICQQSFV